MRTTPLVVRPETVIGLHAHLADLAGAAVLDKSNAAEMRALGQFLEALKIQNRGDFAASYATTIPVPGVGPRIYLPYEPGTPRGVWDLVQQLIVIPHEATHADDARRVGPLAWDLDYLLSPAHRAERWEGHGLDATAALFRYVYGEQASPEALSDGLRHYACGEADVAAATVHLRQTAMTLAHDGVEPPMALAAMAWLDEHAPELRAQ